MAYKSEFLKMREAWSKMYCYASAETEMPHALTRSIKEFETAFEEWQLTLGVKRKQVMLILGCGHTDIKNLQSNDRPAFSGRVRCNSCGLDVGIKTVHEMGSIVAPQVR